MYIYNVAILDFKCIRFDSNEHFIFHFYCESAINIQYYGI